MTVGFIYGGNSDMMHDKSNGTSKVADKLYHIMAYQMHFDGKQWMHIITIQSRQRRWSTIWNLINFPSLVFCVVFNGPFVIFLFLVNVLSVVLLKTFDYPIGILKLLFSIR